MTMKPAAYAKALDIHASSKKMDVRDSLAW